MIDIEAEDWLGTLLPRVVNLAREAGQSIMTLYNDVLPAIEQKPDGSPLTQADLASHHVILSGLGRLSPDWPVLCEEAAEVPFDLRKSWRHFWMVDPLDGTKEFLSRNGEFTVNIALVEVDAPVLGVVYAPVIDKMYFAARGTGAYKDDGETIRRISATRPPNATMRTVVSRSHRPQEESLELLSRGVQNCEFIAMGSSLKFCLVAEGAADVYPRTGATMEWDTAAAHCILVEAGGSMNDLDGNSMNYNKPELLNPGFLAKGASRGALDRTGSAISESLQADSSTPFRR